MELRVDIYWQLVDKKVTTGYLTPDLIKHPTQGVCAISGMVVYPMRVKGEQKWRVG